MRLEEHAIALHIENSQTEAMARELTVVEKGPLTRTVHRHALMCSRSSRRRFSSTAASSSARICAKGGQLLGGQPTKRFRDGLYEELFIGASPFIALISD